MPITINELPVAGITKTAVFSSLTITQNADGRMQLTGSYQIELRDASGALLTSIGNATFGYDHEKLVENPNFPLVYGIIRDLARAGLASVHPDLVTQ